MSLSRRIRRRDNTAGLKEQLKEKENEIFGLKQNLQMQNMYMDEMAKISTALKDIMVRELGITEEEVTEKLDIELGVAEAEEIDKVVEEAEKTEAVEEPIEEIISEVEAPKVEPVAEEKPKKKRKSSTKKESSKKED
jgi:outer membrane biosynthesis protein TonB